MKPAARVQFKTDSFSFLNLIIKYWKIFLLGGVGAFVISAALSLTITPLFRSTVVIYPTTNVVETQTLFGMQSNATPLFGDESATEKVLQILRSDRIREYLVGKYDLMKHYGIDENARYKYSILASRMEKYIVSRKTQYNSIDISVLDTDPLMAATIANDISRQVDTVFNSIVKESGRKSYSAINNSYSEQLIRVKTLEDSLHMTGINGSPSSVLVNFRAGSRDNPWAASYSQTDPEFLRLMNMFESENENLSAIRSRLTGAKMLAEQDLPYIHIINEARVSERKAIPKRSRIVIAATLSTLLLMTFVLALQEVIVKDEKES